MSRFPLLVVAAALAIASAQTPANAQGMRYSVHRNAQSQDPALNNYLSARYDYLLETNPAFRSYRMWKECHTINWMPLHSDCIGSFDQYEPYRGP